jgi:transcriptional regulator with XRE-family HTH domain
MADTETRADFARRLGVNRSYVTRLAQAGRLVEDAAGLVLVEQSLARIEETADPNRDDVRARHAARRHAAEEAAQDEANAGGGDPPEGTGDDRATRSFARARADKEHYLALTARREYEQLIGRLVEADSVRAGAAEAGAILRGLLENLADRLAPVVAPVADEDEVRRLIDDEVEAVLNQLAGRFAEAAAKPEENTHD